MNIFLMLKKENGAIEKKIILIQCEMVIIAMNIFDREIKDKIIGAQ